MRKRGTTFLHTLDAARNGGLIDVQLGGDPLLHPAVAVPLAPPNNNRAQGRPPVAEKPRDIRRWNASGHLGGLKTGHRRRHPTPMSRMGTVTPCGVSRFGHNPRKGDKRIEAGGPRVGKADFPDAKPGAYRNAAPACSLNRSTRRT